MCYMPYSDIQVYLFIVDVETNTLLPDCVPWVRISDPCWNTDGNSFFYSKYLIPNTSTETPNPSNLPTTTNLESTVDIHNGIYLHVLGDDTANDIYIFG